MAKNTYPIVANCNYESADDPTVQQVRKAVEAGLTDDEGLIEALDRLEETLREHADSDSVRAIKACERAEARVLAAWTDAIQEAVEAERQSRYRD